MNRSSKLQTVNNGSGSGVAESDAGLPQSHEERIVKKFDAGDAPILAAKQLMKSAEQIFALPVIKSRKI